MQLRSRGTAWSNLWIAFLTRPAGLIAFFYFAVVMPSVYMIEAFLKQDAYEKTIQPV